MNAKRWSPSVTVAAIAHDNGMPRRYLLVEEHTPEGLKLNNPAGHLEPGEGPEEGVMREALEETACRFHPTALLGVYLSRFQRPASGEDITYVRFAYVGTASAAQAGRALDDGIVRTLWLTLDEVRSAATAGRLRSDLVLRCLQDAESGVVHPLSAVMTDCTLRAPEIKR